MFVNAGGSSGDGQPEITAQFYDEHPMSVDDYRRVTIPYTINSERGSLGDRRERRCTRNFDAFSEWVDDNA